jgi:hypothetical protein
MKLDERQDQKGDWMLKGSITNNCWWLGYTSVNSLCVRIICWKRKLVPFILRNCIKILVACTCTLFGKRAAGYQKRNFVCLCMKIIHRQRRTVPFTLGPAWKFLYHALTHQEGETWCSGKVVALWPWGHEYKSWKQPLAEMQGKTMYIRSKMVRPFPVPCESGSYVHQTAFFYALTHQHVAGYEKKELCFLLMIYTTMDRRYSLFPVFLENMIAC